ncbi:GGDEF domain-containing protein [Limimaricola sp.]|uniref:GGDEF domain-containing protein n=1 Tax=Limimaricola sp. TaxID=2211665 RepID=UPI0025BC62CA|nr:GGDEF domain-containing protein [Limimaricola sp.]
MQIPPGLQSFLIATMAIGGMGDFLRKGGLFLGLVNGVAYGTEFALTGTLHAPLSNLLITSLTTLPFMALIFYVVTQMRSMQRQLADLAMTDMLTGLPNRRAFFEHSQRASLQSPRGVVFLIDADYFKRINDSHGHAVGDLCLQAMAARIRTVLRQGDIVGRVGGEEFAAFLPGAPLRDAVEIGQRLVEAIEVDLGPPAGAVSLTMSIGAAEITRASGFDQILRLADDALYHAKETGRARLVVWQPGLSPVAA